MRAVAVRTEVGITLRVYDGEAVILEAPLEPKAALLVAIDLLQLIAGEELRIDRISEPLFGPARWGEKPDL